MGKNMKGPYVTAAMGTQEKSSHTAKQTEDASIP